MDLNQLVAIGIVPAVRKPLSVEKLAYLDSHGIGETLGDIISKLADEKPSDPYKFLAEALQQQASTNTETKKPQPPKEKREEKGKTQAVKQSKDEVKAPTAGSKEDEKASSKVKAAPTKGGGLDIKKSEDVPGWYEQVLVKSELVDHYPLKGCFILRPWSFKLWEIIQGWLDNKIKTLGVENCYFPMFIPQAYLATEKEHLEGFAPEMAMVTKFGDQDLDEPVAIRPTSETAMYASFANWVQSHRDLPIKLNQWCNVVRWEVRQTSPFLRTREFLWQEGHTAHYLKKNAEKEVLDVLEFYAGVYEHLLAVPVVRGTKTKAETFAGADYTTTCEAFVPATGRAIQGATSHHLGQNFSHMFDISFQDPSDSTGQTRSFAYQNSWGLSTRVIGVMLMVHGDDKGVVMPPNVASLQVVVVPVGLKASTSQEEKDEVQAVAIKYGETLTNAGIRVKVDTTDERPGWKFNHWEMKGVPLRIELGPSDVKKDEFVMAKRNLWNLKNGGKVTGKGISLLEDVNRTLDEIQGELYNKVLVERDSRMVTVDKWEDFSPKLNEGKMLLIPFCGDPTCEEAIKERSKAESAEAEVAGGLKMGAKSLCVPHEDKYKIDCPSTCIFPGCGAAVVQRTLFGRSY